MTRDETKHIGSGALTAVAVSALITLSALALSIPGSALSSGNESPTPDTSLTAAPSSAPSTTSPLLEALAYEPLKRDLLGFGFDFTDWTALKALHGGDSITSASPLQERQRLMLDIVRSEASTTTIGLDRLATWPEGWG